MKKSNCILTFLGVLFCMIGNVQAQTTPSPLDPTYLKQPFAFAPGK